MRALEYAEIHRYSAEVALPTQFDVAEPASRPRCWNISVARAVKPRPRDSPLAWPLLVDDDIRATEPELPGEHEPDRPGTDDDYSSSHFRLSLDT